MMAEVFIIYVFPKPDEGALMKMKIPVKNLVDKISSKIIDEKNFATVKTWKIPILLVQSVLRLIGKAFWDVVHEAVRMCPSVEIPEKKNTFLRLVWSTVDEKNFKKEVKISKIPMLFFLGLTKGVGEVFMYAVVCPIRFVWSYVLTEKPFEEESGMIDKGKLPPVRRLNSFLSSFFPAGIGVVSVVGRDSLSHLVGRTNVFSASFGEMIIHKDAITFLITLCLCIGYLYVFRKGSLRSVLLPDFRTSRTE